MPEWSVPEAQRLDTFLAKDSRMLSRAKARSLIEAGRVRIDGRIVKKPAHRLRGGETVSILADQAHSVSSVLEADMRLPILYEDDACFVIDKPAGIIVHPGAGTAKGEFTLLSGIAFLFRERALPFSPSSVLVHRLDKETTGCLLIAKTPASHANLQKQFGSRSIHKKYLALAAGIPSPASAIIDAPVGRSTTNRTTMAVFGASKSRPALTTYHTLASSEKTSLLACDLHTGRTHQLRVHLHVIHHPILGDASYGTAQSEELSRQYGIESLCLHAWKLAFRSPADGQVHEITASPPSSFLGALKRVGIEYKGIILTP